MNRYRHGLTPGSRFNARHNRLPYPGRPMVATAPAPIAPVLPPAPVPAPPASANPSPAAAK